MAASLFTAAHQQIVRAVVALRKSAGLTQRDLAAALGREQNLIARIETGQRRVDLVEFILICRACGADAQAETAKLVREMQDALPRQRSRYTHRRPEL